MYVGNCLDNPQSKITLRILKFVIFEVVFVLEIHCIIVAQTVLMGEYKFKVLSFS